MAEARGKLAIVGMAFRFPGGVADEESFWKVLSGGRDVVGEIDSERWPADILSHPARAEPGRSVTFAAGTLERPWDFDAAFFGISPREAQQMDPQQRLLLELSWEALENGGQPPARLAGSDCAVFVGVSAADFMMHTVDDMSAVDAHTMTGSTMSIVANRLSYLLDLRGQSVAVDTACSSSLTALHLACSAIQHGDASTALVGGVNMLLHPLPFVGFSKASMLSAGGRCRAFDASGDGYVRAEGGAVLFIKPLEDALRDGDPVHAVILATGTNSDGRNEGLTIPNSAAQVELLRTTARKANVQPADLVYLEAHGTGTAVGDPIEAAAISEAFGRERTPDRPLPIGSVKSNIGHLEAASGLAGLIKTVLSLKRRALPPSIHLETPNPAIDFRKLNLEVVTELTPLPESALPARAGVNSFGFGGANAHVLLEEFVAGGEEGVLPPADPPPLLLSARDPEALRSLAGLYSERLRGCDAATYYAVAHSAAHRRAPMDHGLALVGGAPEDAAGRLDAFVEGRDAEGLVREDRLPGEVRVALVYSGNGSQWAGMGRRLLREEPLFLESIRSVDSLLAEYTDLSIEAELERDVAEGRMHLTEVAQPALLAVQVGLTEMLRRGGLTVDAAIGHSVGEIAAAWAVGGLTLAQAVQVIYERSAAQARTAGAGRMAAVGMPAESVEAQIKRAGLTREVELAGVNSPNDVTLSGSFEALEILKERLRASGVFFRLLDLDYAFHSRCMDGQRERILTRLAGLRPQPGDGLFVSTVTGEPLECTRLDATYWWENIRKPVVFDQAVGHLAADGVNVFLEVGPHAILQKYMASSLRQRGRQGRILATLRRGDDGPERLTEALLRVRLLGGPVTLASHFPVPSPSVPLPGYPWQHESHRRSSTSEGHDLLEWKRVHPLLGWRVEPGEPAWENLLDVRLVPWLADHRVGDAVILPATGFVELALAAAAEWEGGERQEIEDLEIRAALPLDPDRARQVRFDLDPSDGTFRIRSRERLSEEPWRLNAVGRIAVDSSAKGREDASRLDPGELVGLEASPPLSTRDDHYRLARQLGFAFGPSFQGFQGVWRREGGLLARVERPATLAEGKDGHLLHPALLDSCLQVVLDHFRDRIEAGEARTFIPVRVGRLQLFAPGVDPAWCTFHLVRGSERSILADFELFDEEGVPVARLEGCRMRDTPLLTQAGSAEPTLWRWQTELKPPASATRSAVPISPPHLAAELGQRLEDDALQFGRRAHYEEALPLLDAMVGSFIYEAVCRGARGPGDPLPPFPEAFAKHPMASWLVDVLAEDGLVRTDGEDLRLVARPETQPSAREIWLAVMGDHPQYLPDLMLAGRVGLHLPRIVAGELDPEALAEALDAEGSWSRYHAVSPSVLALTDAVTRTLSALAANWPAERRLRILDMGPEPLFPRLVSGLPAGRCDYVHAWSDAAVSDQLRSRFGEHPGVVVCGLDPATLALEPEAPVPDCFDVVVVGDGLAGLGDPRQAVRNLGAVLAPEGILLFRERRPDRWSALTHGLRRGWWRPGTKPRPGQMVPGEWQTLLEEEGFVDPQVISEPHSDEGPFGSFLMVARGAGASAVETATQPDPATWLFMVDREGAGHRLAEQLAISLTSRGQRVLLAEDGDSFRVLGPGRYAFEADDRSSVKALMAAVARDGGHCDHVVHLLGLACETAPPDPLDIPASRCLSSLHLLRVGADLWGAHPPRLWLVTRGAATFADPERVLVDAPAQAPLWGLGRVVMNEHPEVRCTLIDLQDDGLDATVAARLGDELLEPDGEDEVILAHGGRRLVSRLRFADLGVASSQHPASVHLDFSQPGQLRNLEWRPRPRAALGPRDVEIATVAVGLNFRDVMYTLGLLPDEAVEQGFAGPTLGMEVAGRIARVGASVTEFAPGDDVVAFTSGGFAGRVVTPAEAVAHKPAGWTHEAAATVPSVFFTVWYALHHLAKLQPGERVLIHGAAGGVGNAAIQVARHLGAEIVGTAGSEEKRDFVRLLGADHVMDSRQLTFAEEILEATHGEGVDVILNSLAGEALRRNLQVLRPFGRFVELGKRDYYENTRLGLRPFKDNITYFGVDADQLMAGRPALARTVFGEVMELFAKGVLRPLPYRAFPATEVVEAFRYMQQSRQIGKVVVNMDDTPLPVPASAARTPPLRLRADATYLVTGGTGGFGLRTACWLAEKGARHLLLLSRRGAEAPEAGEARAEIEARGATAYIRACDVGDAEALRAVVEECGRELPPLRGVVHAAMVLDDGLLRNLDNAHFLRAMTPKIRGAWNLHALTRESLLDLFVLFSSATTSVGNPGQGNYVAANLYLEALADLRRKEGLAATCVAWGVINDAGYLARNTELRDALLARVGGVGVPAATALDLLEAMIGGGGSGLAISDFDWNALQRLLPSEKSSRFSALRRRASQRGSQVTSGVSISALVSGMSREEAEDLVTDLVTDEISQILRLPKGQIHPERSLYELGLDSLMGLELMVGLERRIGVAMPGAELLNERTVQGIVRRLLVHLGMDGDGTEKSHDGNGEDGLRRTLEGIASVHGVPVTGGEIDSWIEAIGGDDGASAETT